VSDGPQGPGWWQASDLKWYPPDRHADSAAPPSTQASAPTTKNLRHRIKVWLLLAGIALVLVIAALVAGRVLLGDFLPGMVLVGAIAAIAATLVIRSGRSVQLKAIAVTAIVLVVAAAVPASLKAGYPIYHRIFPDGGTSSSSAPAGGPSASAPAGGPSASAPSGGPPTSASSGGTSAHVPSAVRSGILALIGPSNTSVVKYGFIDPDSGTYSEVASFNTSECLCSGRGEIYVSPDFTKYAITKTVSGHQDAGWIGTNGQFTDVTTHENPGEFGGRPSNFSAIGFDGAGNFYYEAIAAQATDDEFFKLPAGSTSNPEKIQHGNLASWYLDQDGSIKISLKVCFQPVWAGPNKVLEVSGVGYTHGVGTQINKADAAPDTSTGCVKSANPVPLLPKTNTAVVDNAVSNRDGTQVAFKLQSQSGGQDLYTVAADGAGQPKKVPLSNSGGAPLAQVVLLNWR
jgi:hypothetical protein